MMQRHAQYCTVQSLFAVDGCTVLGPVRSELFRLDSLVYSQICATAFLLVTSFLGPTLRWFLGCRVILTTNKFIMFVSDSADYPSKSEVWTTIAALALFMQCRMLMRMQFSTWP